MTGSAAVRPPRGGRSGPASIPPPVPGTLTSGPRREGGRRRSGCPAGVTAAVGIRSAAEDVLRRAVPRSGGAHPPHGDPARPSRALVGGGRFLIAFPG